MSATRLATCNQHCRGCGAHFHGLAAFDRHRPDGYCEEPGSVLMRTGIRAGQPALQVWTHEGACEHVPGCWVNGHRDHYEQPVTIWQVATTEQQREQLAALRQKRPQDAKPKESGAKQAALHLGAEKGRDAEPRR